jgi:lysophospholipase L1-like esterase
MASRGAVWILSIVAVTCTMDQASYLSVMPFGDSISTCCHTCVVSPLALPKDQQAFAEPFQPFQGYMRPLFHTLTRMQALWRSHSAEGLDTDSVAYGQVEFVGRRRDCIFRIPNNTRAYVADWPVRYEAQYGATTRRLLTEGFGITAIRKVVAELGARRVPRITLMQVGTNDLIAVKDTGDRIGRAIDSTRLLLQTVAFAVGPHRAALLPGDNRPTGSGMALGLRGLPADEIPAVCAMVEGRRAVVLSVPIPIIFERLVAGAKGARRSERRKRARRHAALRAALFKLFTELTGEHVPLVDAARRSSVIGVGTLLAHRVRWNAIQRECGCWRKEIYPSGCPMPDVAYALSVDTSYEGTNVDVILVDQSVRFDAFADLHGDGLHPRASGEAKIAATYAAAIQLQLRRWNWIPAGAVMADDDLYALTLAVSAVPDYDMFADGPAGVAVIPGEDESAPPEDSNREVVDDSTSPRGHGGVAVTPLSGDADDGFNDTVLLAIVGMAVIPVLVALRRLRVIGKRGYSARV